MLAKPPIVFDIILSSETLAYLSGPHGHEITDEITRLRAEVERLTRERDDTIARQQTAEVHAKDRMTAAGVYNLRVREKLAEDRAEAADQAAVLSHLHNTEDSQIDKLVAKGWLGIHELILRMIAQITKLAMNKFQ